jgi:uncharacterized protein
MEVEYQRLKAIVEKEMKGASPAHDIDHVMRVYNLCLKLAKHYPDVDLKVLKTSALLHDIARLREDKNGHGHSLKIDHAVLGAEMSVKILRKLGYSGERIEQVAHCIRTHRFRGGNQPITMEAKILSDADKLDVLGATGVARSFTIGGECGQRIYSGILVDEYVKKNFVGGKVNGRIIDPSEHSPNLEFETKFKGVQEKLYTEEARKIAEQRFGFMEQFFDRLKKEIAGEL